MRFEFGTVFSRFFSLAGLTLPAVLAVSLLGYALPDMALTWAFTTYLGQPPAFDSSNILSPANLYWAMLGGGGLTSIALYMINLSMVSEIAILRGAGKPVNILSVLGSALINALPILIISIISTLWIMLGFLALIVPGIILALGLSVVIPAYVGERHLGIFGAMKRSLDLTRDNRGTIFLVQLVFGLLVGVVGGGAGTAILTMLNKSIDQTWVTLINTCFTDLLNIPMNLLTVTFYVCLREAKDKKTPDQAASVFD